MIFFAYSCLHWTGHRVSHPQLWWLRVPGKILNSAFLFFLYAGRTQKVPGMYLSVCFIFIHVFFHLPVCLSICIISPLFLEDVAHYSGLLNFLDHDMVLQIILSVTPYRSIYRPSTYLSLNLLVYLLVSWSAASPCLSPTIQVRKQTCIFIIYSLFSPRSSRFS